MNVIQTDEGDEERYLARLSRWLLESLGGVGGIPIFVIDLERVIYIEAVRPQLAHRWYPTLLTHSSSWIQHGRPSAELIVLSKQTSVLIQMSEPVKTTPYYLSD